MAIRFFDIRDRGKGFAGWRVSGTLRGKRYQFYFSLRNPHPHIYDDVWARYQYLRAHHCEARQRMRAHATQYFKQLRTEHSHTLPGRGLGFGGMTLAIAKVPGSDHYHCQFSVNCSGQAKRFAIHEHQSFDQAWEAAINYWAHVYEIREKDAVRVRHEKKPSPEVFKTLRRILNDEDEDIGVEVLHYVFATQRTRLKRQQAAEVIEKRPVRSRTLEPTLDDNDMAEFAASLAAEIKHFASTKR